MTHEEASERSRRSWVTIHRRWEQTPALRARYMRNRAATRTAAARNGQDPRHPARVRRQPRQDLRRIIVDTIGRDLRNRRNARARQRYEENRQRRLHATALEFNREQDCLESKIPVKILPRRIIRCDPSKHTIA